MTPPADQDSLAELRALLFRARNPALPHEDAESILGRSAELARRYPSERASALHAQTEIAVRISPVRVPPSPRMAALAQRLRGRDEGHIGALAMVLRELGFHADDELTAAEALYFQSVTAEPVMQTVELYRGGDLTASRLRVAVAELHALATLIPVCAAEAAASVHALAGELDARAVAADEHTLLERLGARLEALLKGQPPSQRRLAEARRDLKRNRWAASHPGHPDVLRASTLIQALEARHAAGELLASLAARVRGALAPAEPDLARAVELIADAFARAEESRLDDAGALCAAAEQVAGAAAATLSGSDARDPGATLDAMLTRTRSAEQAIGWLRQLPTPLRDHVAQREEAFARVLADAAQRSRTLLADRIGHDLGRLPAAEAAAYAAELQASEHPLVRWQGDRLARLAEGWVELAETGDLLDDAVLERFGSETAVLPDGPLKEVLTGALAECRAARSELARLLRELETAADPERVGTGLEALEHRFPRWTRPRHALGRLADHALLRRIGERAGPEPEALADALGLAAEIADPERRALVSGSLRHYADTRTAVDVLTAAATRADHRPAGEAVAEVARLARELLTLVGGPAAGDCAEEFPALWNGVDGRAREALMTRVPALLEGSLQAAAQAAPSVVALDAVGNDFSVLVEGLGAIFHGEPGMQILERRRVELLVGTLEAAGEFDRAIELLRGAAGAFRPDEIEAAEGRLATRAALARFAREGGGSIDGVVDTVLRYGPWDDLMDALFETFTSTGVTAPLATVARGHDARFERSPGAMQLARWCLRFERGDFDALVAELRAREAKGKMRDDFVAAIARSPGKEAQAFYVLRGVQDTGDREERDLVAQALGALTVRMETAHAELLADLDALEGELNRGSDYAPSPVRPSLDELRGTAARAREVISHALASVRHWHESTASVAAWTNPVAIPRRGSSTLERLAALRARLQANEGVLAALEDALSTLPGPDARQWDDVEYRMVALGADSVAPVAALSKMLHEHVVCLAEA